MTAIGMTATGTPSAPAGPAVAPATSGPAVTGPAITGPAAVPAPAASWPGLIGALLAGESLDAGRTAWAMREIMAGAASPAQVAGFAVALRAKGETPEEIGGLVEAMLTDAAGLSVPEPVRAGAVDTCGTGGDRSNTVNISTMAALVVAGAGVTVIKHGGRASSSACGSADVLAELGVVVDLPPAGVEACLAAAGIAFCFAPVFHPAMRHVSGPRRDLGVPTAFNVLGPLSNPARTGAQAIGVADARLAPVVAQVLANRGVRALVFRGDDGLDELTPATTSTVWVVRAPAAVADDALDGSGPDGTGTPKAGPSPRLRREVFDPREVGIHVPDIAALRGADARHNAAVARAVLAGEPGPVRDTVLLAAAAALVAADGPSDAPVTEQIAAALPRAAQALDSGAALAALERWTGASQAAAGMAADLAPATTV